MTLDTYVRAQMARFAIEEAAHHGGITNMLAIAHVLRNRVFAGWGDWLEVVQRAPERRANILETRTPNLRSGDVRILLNRIDEVYTRVDLDDPSGGALFYVEPNLPMQDWFRKEVLERPDDHLRTAHIGLVWFFS